MKIFVALALISLVASSFGLPEEMKKIAQAARAKCITETGATRKQVDEAMNGKYNEDPKLIKFAYCFLTSTKLLNEDSSINKIIVKLALKDDVDENTLKKLEATCIHDKSKPKEVAAALLFKCFYEVTKKPILID